MIKSLILLVALAAGVSAALAGETAVFDPKAGPGGGRHVVLICGDEEYRSEEVLPMLARILSQRHGFKCTVLFPINPKDGTIDPNNQTNIVGMATVQAADLVVLFTRFRELPDDQMKYFVDYLESGKPVIGIRTATHAFAYDRNKQSRYARYDWRSKEWPGGFGQQVLGDTWISHHGAHGKESTRGVLNPALKDHPVLRGVSDIWGPTDVYGIVHLPSDAQVLVHGQVLQGMKPDDPPVDGPKNNPMMPLIWLREHAWPSGQKSRVVATTIGAATDLVSEGLRRLLVNATYWAVGLESQTPQRANVDFVGEFKPTAFGFKGFRPGVRPEQHELR